MLVTDTRASASLTIQEWSVESEDCGWCDWVSWWSPETRWWWSDAVGVRLGDQVTRSWPRLQSQQRAPAVLATPAPADSPSLVSCPSPTPDHLSKPGLWVQRGETDTEPRTVKLLVTMLPPHSRLLPDQTSLAPAQCRTPTPTLTTSTTQPSPSTHHAMLLQENSLLLAPCPLLRLTTTTTLLLPDLILLQDTLLHHQQLPQHLSPCLQPSLLTSLLLSIRYNSVCCESCNLGMLNELIKRASSEVLALCCVLGILSQVVKTIINMSLCQPEQAEKLSHLWKRVIMMRQCLLLCDGSAADQRWSIWDWQRCEYVTVPAWLTAAPVSSIPAPPASQCMEWLFMSWVSYQTLLALINWWKSIGKISHWMELVNIFSFSCSAPSAMTSHSMIIYLIRCRTRRFGLHYIQQFLSI